MADQPDAIQTDLTQHPPVQGEHGVAFEAKDIDTRQVFIAGLAFAGIVVASSVFCLFLFWFLLAEERSRKGTDLPAAAADAGERRLPPQPRLEALEDLRDRQNTRYELLPPRAEEYFKEQREKLVKIDDAIQEAKAKLPARAGSPAPRSFQRPLPSKASSGWTETGGR
jgi:hypothetical protein